MLGLMRESIEILYDPKEGRKKEGERKKERKEVGVKGGEKKGWKVKNPLTFCYFLFFQGVHHWAQLGELEHYWVQQQGFVSEDC